MILRVTWQDSFEATVTVEIWIFPMPCSRFSSSLEAMLLTSDQTSTERDYQ